MGKLRIATIGYLLTDWLMAVEHFPITPGDHQKLNELDIELGGMCNFLIAGRRLGGEMVALDTIGADRNGKLLLEALKAEGVDVTQVVKVKGARSRAVVVMSTSDQQYAFMGYPGSELTEQGLSAKWKAALDGADALYLDGFSLLQEHISGTALKVAKEMHARGGKVFLDPGPRVAEIARQELSYVNVVLLTANELKAWVGLEGAEGAWSLLDEGPELVVVKQGREGCTIFSACQEIRCAGYSVTVRDTLGAGDVFNAAFVLALLQGKSLAECGALANSAGAAQVQKFGAGRNVPSREEVEAIFKKGKQ
jgi:ribokinase